MASSHVRGASRINVWGNDEYDGNASCCIRVFASLTLLGMFSRVAIMMNMMNTGRSSGIKAQQAGASGAPAASCGAGSLPKGASVPRGGVPASAAAESSTIPLERHV